MGGQIDFTVSLALIALFAIAIIGFATNFAIDNGSSISLSDDPEINTLNSQLQSNSSSFASEAEDTYTSIVKTTVDTTAQSARSVGPFKPTTKSIVNYAKNILLVGYKKIFGSENGFSIFITTFTALIVLIIGLYIYKTMWGNPN